MFGEFWCTKRFSGGFRSGNFMRSAVGCSEYQEVFLWLFRIWIMFGWCDGWYFHVNEVDVFCEVRFDLIKFHFDRCFKLQFDWFYFVFGSVVDTCIFKPFFKRCSQCRNILPLVNQFLWKLGSFLLYILGGFWESQFLLFDVNQLISNLIIFFFPL